MDDYRVGPRISTCTLLSDLSTYRTDMVIGCTCSLSDHIWSSVIGPSKNISYRTLSGGFYRTCPVTSLLRVIISRF